MEYTILVADDDEDIRKLVRLYLENSGYRIIEAVNGTDALAILNKKNFDLVILDIMMPEKDGLETLLEIRKDKFMPVIFLTAKDQEIDMLQGLSIGADDYIAKPFSSMELLIRVKTLLRRYIEFDNKNKNIIKIEQLEIRRESRQVFVDEQEIMLTPTEYRILELLCLNRNTVFSIDKLCENLWNERDGISDTSVMMHIAKIRRKIEINPKDPQYLKTVWGVGYKV